MKKLMRLMSILLVVSSLFVACSSGKYKDGTYTGEGKGASSNIKVEVTVKSGKIDNIEVLEHKETETIIEGVKNELIPNIIEKQSTEDVEAVSGASSSSKGVIEAVNQALEGANK